MCCPFVAWLACCNSCVIIDCKGICNENPYEKKREGERQRGRESEREHSNKWCCWCVQQSLLYVLTFTCTWCCIEHSYGKCLFAALAIDLSLLGRLLMRKNTWLMWPYRNFIRYLYPQRESKRACEREREKHHGKILLKLKWSQAHTTLLYHHLAEKCFYPT